MGNYWAEIADRNQTDRQLQFLRLHIQSQGYVLDIGCGTGRHLIPLCQQGFNIMGLDVSAKLLRIAKQRSREINAVLGDMRHLPFKAEAFAAAINMDTSFGYLPSESDDLASLAEVHRVLFRHGILVIDVFNREELILRYRNEKHSSKLKEYPSFFLRQKRTISQMGDWLCDLWTISDKASGQLAVFEHSVRLYGESELWSLLEKAGFAVEEIFGSYDEEKFSSDSPRLIMIAKAN